jgi:hypothetical protein
LLGGRADPNAPDPAGDMPDISGLISWLGPTPVQIIARAHPEAEVEHLQEVRR